MNYYPFHLGDYAVHTAHLEPMEDLAYRRLLDLYYRLEGPLPAVDETVRLIRMRDHVPTVCNVLEEFFEFTDAGTWRHARCDAEIARMQDKQAKARASAEASVNARRTNAQRTLNERSADVELPTPTPTPTPNTSVPTERPPEAARTPEELTKQELWDAGKSLLAEQGMPAKQCGTFVGKLVKDYGPDVVVEAVRSAVVQRPVDAAEFLVGACKLHKRLKEPEPVTVASDAAEKTAEMLRAKELTPEERAAAEAARKALFAGKLLKRVGEAA